MDPGENDLLLTAEEVYALYSLCTHRSPTSESGKSAVTKLSGFITAREQFLMKTGPSIRADSPAENFSDFS
jgi:hypothetical protein